MLCYVVDSRGTPITFIKHEFSVVNISACPRPLYCCCYALLQPLTNTPVAVDEAVATALESSTSVALEE